MKVKPVYRYHLPKYPRSGENVQIQQGFRLGHKALTLLAVCGSLTGCFPFILQGEPPTLDLMTEEEMIQILLNEAEERGITFNRRDDVNIKYSGIDINLDLYNEEKQIGIAVVDRIQAYDIYLAGKTEDHIYNYEIYEKGIKVKGGTESEQPENFLLAAQSYEGYEEYVRETLRDFIEWLQEQGII